MLYAESTIQTHCWTWIWRLFAVLFDTHTHTHNFYADLAIFFPLLLTTQCIYTEWGDRLCLMSSINTCFYVFWHVFFLLFKVVAVKFFCLLKFLSIGLLCLNSISTLCILIDVNNNHLNNRCVQYWSSGRIDIELFPICYVQQTACYAWRTDGWTHSPKIETMHSQMLPWSANLSTILFSRLELLSFRFLFLWYA